MFKYGLRSTLVDLSSNTSVPAACRRMRRLDAFLYLTAQNFKLVSKISNQNLNFLNTYRLTSYLLGPIQWHHSQIDLIWAKLELKMAGNMFTRGQER
jgi:hypothetical protein